MRTIEVGSNTADLYYGDGPSLEVLKSIPKGLVATSLGRNYLGIDICGLSPPGY